MSTPEQGVLDRATERAARWLGARSSRRSLLGRVGDRLITLPPLDTSPAPPPADPPAAQHPDIPPPDIPPPPPPPPLPAAAEPAAPEPEQAPAPAGTVVLPGDPVGAAVAISRARLAPGSCTTAVLVPADALVIAIAAPVAALLEAPLLIAGADDTEAELARLGVTRRVAVGAEVDGAEQIGRPPDPADPADDGDLDAIGALSLDVAHWVRAQAGSVRAFALAETDDARALAGPVGAAAALRRFPVMIGTEAARRGAMEGARRAAVTYLVGPDAIAGAAQVPGGFPLPAPSNEAIAARLAQLLKADGIRPATTALANPAAAHATNALLAACGGVVLFGLPSPTDGTDRVFTVTEEGDD